MITPIHKTNEEILSMFIDVIATVAVVVLPVLLYAKQYFLIKNSGETGSYSPFVSCVILFTSCFRVLYYIGHRYEESILCQGIALFIVHIALLHVYVSTKNKEDGVESYPPESIYDLKKVWAWRSFSKYLQFVAMIVFAYANFYFLAYSTNTVQMTGAIANILDGSVSLPQLIANCK